MTPHIRPAIPDDAALILTLIQELAAFENLAHEVVASVTDLEATLFCENPKVEAVILEVGGEAAGFALFFHNYSTFLGKHGLYIEDLYVRPAYRGQGLGKLLLSHLSALALARGCGRVEWWCLDWNTSATDFYKSLGACPMSEWTVYRLTQKEMKSVAQDKKKAA